ncbi:MAG: AsmA family protein, partial [candidate division KSB1 bacterium]|nr:AsmA family protein [candidate division KSB1 bacterium]
MKKKPAHKRPLLKWLLRLSLMFMLLLLLFASATYLFIKFKYPAEEVNRLLRSELSHALNDRPVEIERVSINPFKGFVVENISIYEKAEDINPAHEKISELSIEKLYLKYNLLSLFKRTIHVSEIRVQSPFLAISVDENGRTNLDDIFLVSQSIPADTTSPDSGGQNIPFNISLNTFAFENLSIDFSYEDAENELDASIRGFSVYADDFFLPRGDYSDIQDGVRGKLRIQSEESPWKIEVLSSQLENRQHFAFSFDTNVNLTADGLKSIMLIGNLRLSELLHQESLDDRLTASKKIEEFIEVSLRVMMDLKNEYARVEHIDLFFGDEKLLSASGDIKALLTDPLLSLKTEQATINLSNVMATVKKIIPTCWYNQVDSVRIAGNLEIEESL